MTRSHKIFDWNPEDAVAWEAGNKIVAGRNLICTVMSDHVAFSIWSLWSVMVLFMPQEVYGFTAADKFLLAAVAMFVGGCVRIPYAMGIAKFGGRNWTTFSALILLIPTVATMLLLAHPGLPLWPYVLCAAATGLGGGNYSASLANVNAFYPQRLKGWALAVNAGGGNLGVAIVQVVGLFVLAIAGNRQPYLVCAVYLVLLAIVGIAAALFMDNLDHRIEVGHLGSILRERHTWVISLLYIGTFGSFIGFSFAFGRVLYINFLGGGQTAAQASLHVAQIAFLGPLLGSLSRIYGGRLADRVGGGRVTLAAFAGMILAAGLLVGVSVYDEHSGPATSGAAMLGYIVGFVALFVLSGIGNGSVFKMIPSIFEARSRGLDASESERRHWARDMSGALIGFAGAVGALGGVAINLALRQSYASTGEETAAFWVFLVFYLGASVLTWAMYVRTPSSATAVPGEHTAPTRSAV
ncbi:nitrate/nitrite transporter [Mycobacterium shimoidei]|uniref:Putative integral membrane nitrite extrusion protein NarK3 (Nitrite facilitator) [Mycobacterium tuberculosis H37Rv] n=1 Tax=Mycobacterium shimoidei TaxID=29313 RepID=A0A1E3TD22_MYCSH|nr:nitrate/nitrite transporter [Mycobacterium shimoidei]MCV7258504.1 NarK/NasA family nitrate transporter [Mycobacterium shimoidei]ODR12272.1 MFS transporter [Mycobacterium shimoidei]ORW78386.1 MFS transporter [Mycobacterium shimoidei]SRX92560.1 putative integral membrane nitrite extrusion protein NarK3 (nitrite facilitator) [Mycobacterium tuberculosis H37Rv] [Mycobacterium shimoidei]